MLLQLKIFHNDFSHRQGEIIVHECFLNSVSLWSEAIAHTGLHPFGMKWFSWGINLTSGNPFGTKFPQYMTTLNFCEPETRFF